VSSQRACPDEQILASIAAAIHARYIRRDSVLNAIGGTPVVRLRRIVGAADADVVIKLEALNPLARTKIAWRLR
jgi:hypothetical protein